MLKKILVVLLILCLFYLITPKALVWSSRAFSDEPCIHHVIETEYLTKISLQYYGTAKYWKELSLINRAPAADLLFPGETLIVPAKKTIIEIHHARSCVDVQSLITRETEKAASNYTLFAESTGEGQATSARERLYYISNDTLAQLSDFVGTSNKKSERRLSMPLIVTGLSGIIFGWIMLLSISQKKKFVETETLKPVLN